MGEQVSADENRIEDAVRKNAKSIGLNDDALSGAPLRHILDAEKYLSAVEEEYRNAVELLDKRKLSMTEIAKHLELTRAVLYRSYGFSKYVSARVQKLETEFFHEERLKKRLDDAEKYITASKQRDAENVVLTGRNKQLQEDLNNSYYHDRYTELIKQYNELKAENDQLRRELSDVQAYRSGTPGPSSHMA